MPGADDTTDLPLPSLEALVAGTMALMTCWADPAPGCRLDLAHQRILLARKVVSNLFFLQHHPHASPALRQVMGNAHGRWLSVASPAHEAAPAAEQHHPQTGACTPPAASDLRATHLH